MSRILPAQSLSGLYAITDNAGIEPVLRGGCRIVQYRHKNTDSHTRRQQAIRLRDLCHRYQALFIINDDVDLALAVAADGVHIGQTDISLLEARQLLGNDCIIGVSCHNSLALAQQAEAQGASYVAFGRFFESQTKPHAPAASLDTLRQAKQQLHIPLVAIGGITRDNAAQVILEGADMVAVIHDLFSARDDDDLETRSRTFTHLFSQHFFQKP